MRVFINDLSSSLGMALRTLYTNASHEVVGSVYDPSTLTRTQHLVSGASTVFLHSNTDAIQNLLPSCDIIIYSLYQYPQDAIAALQSLPLGKPTSEEDNSETFKEYTFIALSTVLTWSRNTMPNNPEFKGFEEEAYKSRKPSRKYAEFKAIETQIMGYARPGQLKTSIIAAGLLYGGVNSAFEYLWQEAWRLEKEALPVLSVKGDNTGSNTLPLLSIYDLASSCFGLTSLEVPLEQQYFIAVDEAKTTLRQVTCAISESLGTGNIVEMNSEVAEEMILEVPNIAALQINLVFDTEKNTLKTLNISSRFASGLVENAVALAKDYITSKDLRALRVAIVGPPQAGKSTWSSKLAKDYSLPLISLQTTVQEIIETETPSSDVLLSMSIEDYTTLRTALTPFALNISNVPDELALSALQCSLNSSQCQNHGYVFDSHLSNGSQAKTLFKIPDPVVEGEEPEVPEKAVEEPPVEEEGVEVDVVVKQRLEARKKRFETIPPPTHAILLDAEDEFLKKRALALSEYDATVSGNTAEAFTARLGTYREHNAEDSSSNLATFFEERTRVEVLELFEADISNGDTVQTTSIYIESGGKPFNFHPTLAEQESLEKEQETRAAELAAKEKEQQDLLSAQESATYADRQCKELARLEIIQKEEADLLEARSAPLRTYLMKNIIPSLTEGMLEVVKMQPEDPVDFLADFLFQKGNELEAATASRK